MNRGTVKTDGKFEWRMQSEGSGNQTEWFRDQLGDEADFTEGDQEGFVLNGAGSISATNGILTVVTGAGSPFGGLQQTAIADLAFEVYHTITIRMKTDSIFDFLVFLALDGNTVQQSNQNSEVGWFDFSLVTTTNFDSINVRKNNLAVEHTFEFDSFLIVGNYDFATHIEGEIEDTWDWEVDNSTEGWSGLLNENVSNGFYRGTMAAAIDRALTPAGLSIDTDRFRDFSIRLNTSDITMDIHIEADLGAGFVDVSSVVDIDSTSQTIYSFDLSDDSDWTGTCVRIRIVFSEQDGVLEGDEVVFTDYVLLLGDFNPSDSVIGLMDSVGTPLLNISTHFFANNTGRMEFELLDATGELSYHWYSDLFGDLDEIFIIGKVAFDVLRSKLDITISSENNSRIDKITFPQEFIVDSGLVPPLFSNEIAPTIFYSSYTTDHSWQKVFIDWIKADYKEREWINTESNINNTNVYSIGWDSMAARKTVNVDQNATYQLVVPYLDSVSGIMITSSDSFTDPVAGDGIFMFFEVYVVDRDDGEHQKLIKLQLGIFESGILPSPLVSVQYGNGTAIKIISGGAGINENPKISFSISLREERSMLNIKSRLWEDAANESAFEDFAANITVADWSDDPSNEFVFKSFYGLFALTGNEDLTAMFEDFGFVEKDIFTDIVNAVVEPVGNFIAGIFKTAFSFLAGIFRAVGDIIGLTVLTMQTAVTGALTTMQTALGAAIGLVETAIGTLKTALELAIGLVETAIGTLQTALETAIGLVETAIGLLETALETAIGLVETAIGTLQDAFETAIGLVQDAIEGVFVFLVAALADILDELIIVIGNILSDIVDVGAALFFFLYDALGLPDLFAIADALLVGFIQFIEAIPQFILDVAAFLVAISSLLVTIGFIWIFILPILFASTSGECFEKMIDHAVLDLTAGASFLGIRIPVPAIIPWGGLLVFTFLTDTVFFGFF